jgi:hypothetical protein
MTDLPPASSIADRYKNEAISIVLMLALLGAAWWWLGWPRYMVAGFAVCILLGPAWPPRWGWLGTLIGMLGLASLAYFYFGQMRVAVVLAVVGVALAALRWKREAGR